MNQCLANWANVATIVLAFAAIIAGCLAYRNIGILKEQRRIETFLKLIDELTNQKQREYRATVHRLWQGQELIEGLLKEENLGQRIARLIDVARDKQQQSKLESGSEKKIIAQKEAIEGIITSLDKVGFFLLGNPPKLKVDSKLKNEAPLWIWTITDDMWKQLGCYIEGVQAGSIKRKTTQEGEASPNYGKYFMALNEEAQKHLRRDNK